MPTTDLLRASLHDAAGIRACDTRRKRCCGLKPHRLEGDLASNDPEFEVKAADIIEASI